MPANMRIWGSSRLDPTRKRVTSKQAGSGAPSLLPAAAWEPRWKEDEEGEREIGRDEERGHLVLLPSTDLSWPFPVVLDAPATASTAHSVSANASSSSPHSDNHHHHHQQQQQQCNGAEAGYSAQAGQGVSSSEQGQPGPSSAWGPDHAMPGHATQEQQLQGQPASTSAGTSSPLIGRTVSPRRSAAAAAAAAGAAAAAAAPGPSLQGYQQHTVMQVPRGEGASAAAGAQQGSPFASHADPSRSVHPSTVHSHQHDTLTLVPARDSTGDSGPAPSEPPPAAQSAQAAGALAATQSTQAAGPTHSAQATGHPHPQPAPVPLPPATKPASTAHTDPDLRPVTAPGAMAVVGPHSSPPPHSPTQRDARSAHSRPPSSPVGRHRGSPDHSLAGKPNISTAPAPVHTSRAAASRQHQRAHVGGAGTVVEHDPEPVLRPIRGRPLTSRHAPPRDISHRQWKAAMSEAVLARNSFSAPKRVPSAAGGYPGWKFHIERGPHGPRSSHCDHEQYDHWLYQERACKTSPGRARAVPLGLGE